MPYPPLVRRGHPYARPTSLSASAIDTCPSPVVRSPPHLKLLDPQPFTMIPVDVAYRDPLCTVAWHH